MQLPLDTVRHLAALQNYAKQFDFETKMAEKPVKPFGGSEAARQRGCNAISRQIMRRLRVQMLQLLLPLLQLLLLLLVPLAVLLLVLLLLFCALLLFQPKVLLAALKLRNKLPLLLACPPLSLSAPFSFTLSFIAISLWLPAPTIRRQPQWPQLLGNLSYAYLAALAIPITRSPYFSCSCFCSALPCLPKRFSILRLALASLCASIARSTFLSFRFLCSALLCTTICTRRSPLFAPLQIVFAIVCPWHIFCCRRCCAAVARAADFRFRFTFA